MKPAKYLVHTPHSLVSTYLIFPGCSPKPTQALRLKPQTLTVAQCQQMSARPHLTLLWLYMLGFVIFARPHYSLLCPIQPGRLRRLGFVLQSYYKVSNQWILELANWQSSTCLVYSSSNFCRDI